MAKNGHLIVRAITTAEDYHEGFMEESEEELRVVGLFRMIIIKV